MEVVRIDSTTARSVVTEKHYLHRPPPVSYAFGLIVDGDLLGVVTFGVPASRHLQISACPSEPSLVLELNRLWVDDSQPRNTESAFVSRALRMLPPRIIVSYADPVQGHQGFVYRALSWRYAGWTDMDRKTPRYDYIPADPATHSRDAFRNGYVEKRRRVPKVKYWTTTGSRLQRKFLVRRCGWPSFSWREMPPPLPVPEGA